MVTTKPNASRVQVLVDNRVKKAFKRVSEQKHRDRIEITENIIKAGIAALKGENAKS
jgi:hypothetical protein